MKKQVILAGLLLLVIAGLVVALSVAQSQSGSGSSPVSSGSTRPTPLNATSEPISIARAAAGGRLDYVQIRIDAGDALDALDEEHSMAALHHAANLQRADIAKALLVAGADANAEDATGKTPLHYAANNGATDVAIALLENGAEPDRAETMFGFTPLHLAAIAGHVEIAQALLAAGASNDVEDAEGAGPIHYARSYEHQDIVDLIVRYHQLRNQSQ